MGQQDGKRMRIALLIVVAVLAITLAVMEALAGQREVLGVDEPTWATDLRRVDEALDRSRASVAARAWHDAYVAALGSRRWEGMLAVGDAALRVGHASGTRLAAGAKARQAYLGALFRAREDMSLDGLLSTAGAFAALGDLALALHCVRIAEPLLATAPDDVSARRMHLLMNRLGEPMLAGRQPPLAGP